MRRLAGDLTGALDTFSQALEIYRATGDRHGEADMLADLGIMRRVSGDLPGPSAPLAGLEIYRATSELNKPDGQAIALEGLGECHLTADKTRTGAAHLRQALEIYQRLGMAPDAERARTRLADLTTT